MLYSSPIYKMEVWIYLDKQYDELLRDRPHMVGIWDKQEMVRG